MIIEDSDYKFRKVPYRVVTVKRLGEIISRYRELSGYECAVKLMADCGLLVLEKDTDSLVTEVEGKGGN